MIYVLCLESKEGMITKEQAFAATLLCIMKENFSSINKINIITPKDCKVAKYNRIVKYNKSLEESFITNFIEQYGLTLTFAILNKLPNKDLNDLSSLKYYLGDILLRVYADPNIPDLIKYTDAQKYIEMIGDSIKIKVLQYYNNIVDDMQ